MHVGWGLRIALKYLLEESSFAPVSGPSGLHSGGTVEGGGCLWGLTACINK